MNTANEAESGYGKAREKMKPREAIATTTEEPKLETVSCRLQVLQGSDHRGVRDNLFSLDIPSRPQRGHLSI